MPYPETVMENTSIGTQAPKRPRGTGRIYKRGSLWWIKYHRNGKAYRESTGGASKDAAIRLLKKRQGEIAVGRFTGLAPERIRISELIELVIADYRDTRKRSIQEVKWRAERHVKPLLGEIRAADFGTQQIKRYVSDRRKVEASDATINRELSIVRRGFTLALQSDPPLVSRAPYIPKLEESNVRQGFIEHAQYLKLREYLPEHLKAIFVVGYHVGVRLGELRQLQWSQVDTAAGEIRLSGPQTKNKKPRTLPIYGDMGTWLEWQRESTAQKWPGCPWVFHYRGNPISGHVPGWRDGCKAADMPALLFHDLRRSAVRNMERAGIPRTVAMSISGHKTESVYRRYDIVSKQDLTAAAVKLEGFGLQAAARAYMDAARGIVAAASALGRPLTTAELSDVATFQNRAEKAAKGAAQHGFGFDLETDLSNTLGTSLGTASKAVQ